MSFHARSPAGLFAGQTYSLRGNETMETNEFRQLCNSPAWQSAVQAYLMQRAMAETMRAKVDAIHREILEECPVYADKRDGGDQILRSRDLYLCSDEALCEDFYAESDHLLKKAGIKPETMPRDHCPALVEEHNLTKVEWVLLNDIAGPHFGVDNDRLLCAGLEKRQQFLDLIVGAVVNSPKFENPLQGANR